MFETSNNFDPQEKEYNKIELLNSEFGDKTENELVR